MYCPSCGENISESTGYCPYCGSQIEDDSSYVIHIDPSGYSGSSPKSKLPLILGLLAAAVLCAGLVLKFTAKEEHEEPVAEIIEEVPEEVIEEVIEEVPEEPLEEVGFECPCKFTVRTRGSEICYVYMEYTGEPSFTTENRKALGTGEGNQNVAFLVYPGKDTNIKMPIGAYTMYYAEGDRWIDVERKFGEDTELFCVDYIWEFYKTSAGYSSETLTMNVEDGTIDIFGIDETDFPDEVSDSEVIK